MAEADAPPLIQLTRYARIARNSQMLLVMEPPERPTSELKEAREAIVQDASDFLTEIQEGVESPYFTTYTLQDTRYIERIAVDKVTQSHWDLRGIFANAPTIKMTDSAETQAASFAYLAASCMRQVRVLFYQAPALRGSVTAPRNLAEFVFTVGKVKEVTEAAAGTEFHRIVQRNDWRTTFAFWEASRWLAGSLTGGPTSLDQLQS